jgi:hypothetical protein
MTAGKNSTCANWMRYSRSASRRLRATRPLPYATMAPDVTPPPDALPPPGTALQSDALQPLPTRSPCENHPARAMSSPSQPGESSWRRIRLRFRFQEDGVHADSADSRRARRRADRRRLRRRGRYITVIFGSGLGPERCAGSISRERIPALS